MTRQRASRRSGRAARSSWRPRQPCSPRPVAARARLSGAPELPALERRGGPAQAVVARESRATTSFPPPGPAIENVSRCGARACGTSRSRCRCRCSPSATAPSRPRSARSGITEHSCSAQANPSGTAACINQAVAADAGAIVTDAIPVALAANAFASAERHHIPVLVVRPAAAAAAARAPCRASGNDKLAYLPLQAANLLKAEAYWTIADSHGKANVLMEPYTDSPSTLAYGASGEAVFKKLCPGCTVATQNIGIATASLMPLADQLRAPQPPEHQLRAAGVRRVAPGRGPGYPAGVVSPTRSRSPPSAGDLPALQAIKAGWLGARRRRGLPLHRLGRRRRGHAHDAGQAGRHGDVRRCACSPPPTSARCR